jgi:hypothetical protein
MAGNESDSRMSSSELSDVPPSYLDPFNHKPQAEMEIVEEPHRVMITVPDGELIEQDGEQQITSGRSRAKGKAPMAPGSSASTQRWRTEAEATDAITQAFRNAGDINPELAEETQQVIRLFYQWATTNATSKTTFSSTGLVRTVRTACENALNAFYENEPWSHKLPSKAQVLALRFCHRNGGLNETVAGILAELCRLDLAQITTVTTPTMPTSVSVITGSPNISQDEIDNVVAEARKEIQRIMDEKIQQLTNRTMQGFIKTEAKIDIQDGQLRNRQDSIDAEIKAMQSKYGADLSRHNKEITTIDNRVFVLQNQIEIMKTRPSISKVTGVSSVAPLVPRLGGLQAVHRQQPRTPKGRPSTLRDQEDDDTSTTEKSAGRSSLF